MLQRIRTLSVQSANGTNTTADRVSLQGEVSQLCAEINRIACKTTFGGSEILSGKTDDTGSLLVKGKVAFQVGANANDNISIDLTSGFTVKQMAGANAAGDGSAIQNGDADGTGHGSSFSVCTAANAQKTLASIDKFIGYVDKKRGEFGAIQNRLESTISNQSNIAENESDARSRIRDTDYAEEAANLSQQNIIQQAATSMLTQANSRPQIALSLLG